MAIIRFKPIARNMKGYDPKKIRAAMQDGLADVGKIIKPEFEKTVRTWSPAGTDGKAVEGGIPKFGVFGPRMIGNAMMLEVSTSHAIYYYLNFGTRSHGIEARRAKVLRFRTQGRGSYRAKTRQGWMGSRAGGPRGPWVMRRYVSHPGTWARGWDITVTEKMASRSALAKAINARMRSALGASGTMVRSVRS